MSAVVIVGAPGSGKTTIGRIIAARLGKPFIDVDQRIEHLAGKPIREIFVEEGEPWFRRVEAEQTIAALDADAVVSLGGGAVATEAIRTALAGHTVVWLKVSVQSASRRVGITASRPLLYGDVRSRLQKLLAERTPWYEEVATITVDTDHVGPDEVADLVFAALPKEIP
jgi:shikimate kinase